MVLTIKNVGAIPPHEGSLEMNDRTKELIEHMNKMLVDEIACVQTEHPEDFKRVPSSFKTADRKCRGRFRLAKRGNAWFIQRWG